MKTKPGTTIILSENIQKIRILEAGACYAHLCYLAQKEGFSGTREQVVKVILSRFKDMSVKEINSHLDYLCDLDVDMEEIIKD